MDEAIARVAQRGHVAVNQHKLGVLIQQPLLEQVRLVPLIVVGHENGRLSFEVGADGTNHLDALGLLEVSGLVAGVHEIRREAAPLPVLQLLGDGVFSQLPATMAGGDEGEVRGRCILRG